MTQQFPNFFPSHVVAFTSDSSQDFSLKDPNNPFSKEQLAYLTEHSAQSISKVHTIKQVHGNTLCVIDSDAASIPLKEADAIATHTKETAISIRTADCLSIFIYDEKNEGIALAHAGWKGTQKRIGPETVAKMKDIWKSDLKDFKVGLGPCIRSCCYEVGPEFDQMFPAEITIKYGKRYFDLAAANIRQLKEAGVPQENIYDCDICAHCSGDYFSYRRDAERSGRMISLMMVKKG